MKHLISQSFNFLSASDPMMLTQQKPHAVLKNPITPPFPAGLKTAIFGMGCFWGAERKLWQLPGVYCTAVGYSGGITKDPSYSAVCTGTTGHAEVVLVVYDEVILNYLDLLKIFWESHNPTSGMRQGNDIGSQYRSVLYCVTEDQLELATKTKNFYETLLINQGFPAITTEVGYVPHFYYAEPYHQQYLQRNPEGYCGLKGTGIRLIENCL